jgi:hypothetical protein
LEGELSEEFFLKELLFYILFNTKSWD